MTQLAALQLGGNALTGSLPPEWGVRATMLPRLAMLGLQGNRLSGTLPEEWGTGFPVRASASARARRTCQLPRLFESGALLSLRLGLRLSSSLASLKRASRAGQQ